MPLPTLLGHLHPALVHFPIACLLIAVLFEWVALKNRAPGYGPGARGLLFCGVLLGALSVVSGFQLKDEYTFEDERAALVGRHQTAGIVAVASALLAVVLGEIYRRGPTRGKKILYLLLLHVAGASVACGAAWGGELHWGPDWLPL